MLFLEDKPRKQLYLPLKMILADKEEHEEHYYKDNNNPRGILYKIQNQVERNNQCRSSCENFDLGIRGHQDILRSK